MLFAIKNAVYVPVICISLGENIFFFRRLTEYIPYYYKEILVVAENYFYLARNSTEETEKNGIPGA